MTICAEWWRRACLGAVLTLSWGCGEAEGALFTATGAVQDEAGRPVAGAVVTDGLVSTLTDDAGRYRLAVRRTALRVVKPGRTPSRWVPEAGPQPTCVLRPLRGGRGVACNRRAEEGFQALHRAAEAVGGLRVWPGTALEDLDVLLLVTPRGVGGAEVRRVMRWVHEGGRLIVCGEWAGYPGLDVETVEALSRPAGITFTGGTLKGLAPATFAYRAARPGWSSLAEAVGPEPLALFGAGEVAVAGEARPLLTAPGAYVVLSTAAAPLLGAVGPYGSGKVFALGDSSLWRDEDSSDSGRPNFSLGGNRRLFEALLVW